MSGWRGAVGDRLRDGADRVRAPGHNRAVLGAGVSPLFSAADAPSADAAVAERLAQLEAARRDNQQKIDQAVAAAQKAAADSAAIGAAARPPDRRLESRPAASPNELAELRQQLQALENRPPRRQAISPNCGNR